MPSRDLQLATILDALEYSKETGRTLRDVLIERLRQHVKAVDGGMAISSASINGKSISRTLLSGIKPDTIVAMDRDSVRRHDEAQTYLIADGNPAPTDAQIYTELERNCMRVTELYSDFSGITRV